MTPGLLYAHDSLAPRMYFDHAPPPPTFSVVALPFPSPTLPPTLGSPWSYLVLFAALVVSFWLPVDMTRLDNDCEVVVPSPHPSHFVHWRHAAMLINQLGRRPTAFRPHVFLHKLAFWFRAALL